MEFTIRNANPNDMGQVLKLIHELAVFEKEPEAVEIDEEELVSEGFGEHPLFQCIVAEVEGLIVGTAIFYYRFSTWKGRSIHLEDLIVTSAMRGTGIGTALYTEVMNFANFKGVRRVEWVVLDWNKNAIDFYEKSGAVLLKDWYLAQMDKDGLQAFISKKTMPK
ncbi:GNAT family N-acetyltransferase [Aquimarina sp. W85]|uniref:GNAT family N-acetyltransferase n=1 Tax=Aquimarina rhodophyticola TaxID=3342246 RepID=UPI00366ED1B5